MLHAGVKRLATHIVFAALLSILVACAVQPPQRTGDVTDPYDYLRQYLDWQISQEMKKHRLSAVSIAVVANQKLVWQAGFGLVDKAASEAATPRTLYRAGSIAKVVNAIAVMRLVEQGVLDLDAPISHYLPHLNIKQHNDSSSPITLRALLSHQAGVPSDLIRGMWVAQPDPFHSTLDYLNQSYASHPPFTIFNYSNLGHNVVAAIIEAATGERYDTYLRTLMQQIGMESSQMSATPTEPPTARAYKHGRLQTELSLRDVPAAGLTTNVVDLVELIRIFDKHRESTLLTAVGRDEMLEDQSSMFALNFDKKVGLGLYHYPVFHRSEPIHGHGGATMNHRSLIKFSANSGYGLALLSNSPNASPSLHRIANKALALLHEAQHGKPAPTLTTFWPPASPDDIVEPSQLVGHYATVGGLATVYQGKDERLKVAIAGRTLALEQKQPAGLYYLNYRWLGVFSVNLGNLGNLGLALRRIDNRDVLVGINTLGRARLIGEKLAQRDIHPAWRERVGKYRITRALELINLPNGGIRLQDGFLVAHARTSQGDQLQVVLLPLNAREARVAGLGRGLGETVFVVNNGGREQLKYSNILFERIK